jgi:class 3 adenylate cyclase
MPEENVIRRLAAILSADVKDYSRLMRNDELATIRMLNACRDVITSLIQQHHGRVVDSPGDNILAEFASVVDGVQAAVAIQKELKVRNAKLPPVRKMEFRVGINLGDIIVEQERIYGDGVNMAARLEAIADPGGICISRTAYDQIVDKLPFGYEYLGEKTVKNISRPVHAYKIIVEPEDLTQKFKRWTAEHIKGCKSPDQGSTVLSGPTTKTSDVSEKKDFSPLCFACALAFLGLTVFMREKSRAARLCFVPLGVLVFGT